MSHIVEIEVPVDDPEVLNAACQRLGLKKPEKGTFALFNAHVTGYAVHLEGWRYPVVFDLETKTVKMDNSNGRWGRIEYLHTLQQAYAVEVTLKTAGESGRYARIEEKTMDDGLIEIICEEY